MQNFGGKHSALWELENREYDGKQFLQKRGTAMAREWHLPMLIYSCMTLNHS